MNPKDIEAKMNAALIKAREIAARAESEKERDFTAEERAQITALVEEAKGYKDQLRQMQSDASLLTQINELSEAYKPDEKATQAGAPSNIVTARKGSLGRQFFESPEYSNWLKENASGGRVSDKARVQSPPVYFNTLITGVDAESGGAFVTPSQSGIVVPLAMRPLTVLDLITMGTTSSDSVEYVRVTGKTNNAAGVAESTETADPDPMIAASGVKPESELTFERIPAPVQTIAHWIPATRRALSDAGQLRTLIDAFLMEGLREELENQVINGSGTGEEIEGFETSITLDQPYSAVLTATLSPYLETTRKAITKVQLAHSTPRAFLFNPADWENIDLARLVKNPQNEGTGAPIPTLFGVPVALNEAVDEGKGYVGDFKQYVVWDREQASISVSDSHANFFIRNLVAILAEMRAAGGLLRTDAICRIALTA